MKLLTKGNDVVYYKDPNIATLETNQWIYWDIDVDLAGTMTKSDRQNGEYKEMIKKALSEITQTPDKKTQINTIQHIWELLEKIEFNNNIASRHAIQKILELKALIKKKPNIITKIINKTKDILINIFHSK